jgi:hypothetical protein
LLFFDVPLGVGNNPESVAPMWRSGVASSQNSPPSHIPQRGQVTEDGSKVTAGNKPADVLKEYGFRLYAANDLSRCGPHVAAVVCGLLLSCNTERLAREACANHVRKSSVLVSGTGLCELTHVAKDRGGRQESVTNSGGDDSLAVVVPFDVSDCGPAEQVGSKYAAACTGEK